MHRPYDPMNAVQIVHFERFLPLLMRYDMGALIKRTAVQRQCFPGNVERMLIRIKLMLIRIKPQP